MLTKTKGLAAALLIIAAVVVASSVGAKEISIAPSAEGKMIDLIKEKKPISLELAEGVSLKMVYVPPGSFQMGSTQEDINWLIVETATPRVFFDAPQTERAKLFLSQILGH